MENEERGNMAEKMNNEISDVRINTKRSGGRDTQATGVLLMSISGAAIIGAASRVLMRPWVEIYQSDPTWVLVIFIAFFIVSFVLGLKIYMKG